MRLTVVAAMVLLASCTHTRIDPSEVLVTAKPEAITCEALPSGVRVLLNIQKHGWRKFRLGTNGMDGPPFSLNWLYYDVLSDASGAMEIHRDRGDPGYRPLPRAHVSINRASSADFLIYIGDLSPDVHAMRFQVAIKDLEGNSYLSQPFRLCDHNPPNCAFQRKPLRGSAELGC